jgi:hypothetical protein
MRCLVAILVLGVAATVHGAQTKKELAPPPPGATLPVVIHKTLRPHKLQAGQLVTAQLVQTVPVGAHVILPKGTTLDGHVVNVSDSSISIPL